MHKLGHDVLHALRCARQRRHLQIVTTAVAEGVVMGTHIRKLVVLCDCSNASVGNECSGVRRQLRVRDAGFGAGITRGFTEIRIAGRWSQARGG